MAHWDSANVKAQLRLTSQRLAQLQDRKNSQGQITRRDIATLLQQGNIELARAKAQNLVQDNVLAAFLGVLEAHVDFVLDHFNELDQIASPSPAMVEAASSIIFASPRAQSRDLDVVRDLLIQHFGPDFARSAIGNRDNHVSPRVIHVLSVHPPTATKLDEYLHNIAKSYGVRWSPELRRQDILNPLSEILDPSSSPSVDLLYLQKLCAHGIPDEPPWLRPRIWKLFFGILPVLKGSWDSELQKQREGYYDLVRRLLEPISSLPAPTTTLATPDTYILDAYQQLSRIPSSVLADLEDKPESSKLSPLDDMAPDDIKIHCASNLDSRLRIIREKDTEEAIPQSTPEISIEFHNDETPEISLSRPELFPSGQHNAPYTPTLLLPSKAHNVVSARRKHTSALLRLLYLHSCINPANRSPHLPSLLVPLYSVLLEEVEPQDAAHVEADTFWLFEAMIGEFSELEDDEGTSLWTKRFSERLSWADAELSTNLKAKGLDPALPHYSNRWLSPLLTQTLPLSSVILVWDAMFSCPMADRNTNPKIDYLLDFCIGMLIRARTALFRLGKPGRTFPGLWAEEHDGTPSPSSREVGDAFLEGMSLLQVYPVDAAGGIERLLQTASDLARRRTEKIGSRKTENISLSARLKVSMWKSLTNNTPSDMPSGNEDSEEASEADQDDGNDTETPLQFDSSGITTRLASTVWRGITNQSSMDVPPSPNSPSPRSPSPPIASPSPATLSTPSRSFTKNQESSSGLAQGSAIIRGYAEKLKDSDTAATLAKISSNWRAKAMLGKWGVGAVATPSPTLTPVSPSQSTSHSRISSLTIGNISKNDEGRRGSLPGMNRTDAYSPPPRPVHFRPPRDSMSPQPRDGLTASSPSSPNPMMSSHSDNLTEKKSMRKSLASLRPLQTSSTPPKGGPRPLLLNSSSLITSPPATIPVRSASSSPGLERTQWAEVMRTKAHPIRRDSRSSVSSLSPSDAFNRPFKSGTAIDWDSDSGGRVVPLNRRSVSPLAPSFRSPAGRPDSASSSGTSSGRALVSPPIVSRGITTNNLLEHGDGGNTGQGRSPVGLAKLSSPPITIRIPSHSSSSEHQRASMALCDSSITPLEPPLQTRKPVRKKTPPLPQYISDDTSDSSVVQVLSKSPRTRSKKNLRRDNSRSAEHKTTNSSSLTPQWPEEHEVATTPRASSFDHDVPRSASPVSLSPRSPRRRKSSADGTEAQPRKLSTDGHEVRARKISTDGISRARKVSTEGKEAVRRIRDSVANEGDDEGYDDLLSAYESEDTHR